MHFAYFDENKYTETSPYFYIGGILLSDENVLAAEGTLSQIQYNFFSTMTLATHTEIHGKDLFHGKGVFKQRKLAERLSLLEDICHFIVSYRIPIRLVRIDVNTHRAKYTYPQPEYQLGLMLILERFCDYLEAHDDIGFVFGDYEKDEITRAVLDFSQFKFHGKTPMYRGRPLGRLIDTIYFTHSHHSRFLQVADVVIYLANRFEGVEREPEKWHEKKGWEIWRKIRNNTDFYIQNWP